LSAEVLKQGFRGLGHSRVGLAIPVTFLILFVSMLGVIAVTYYYAIEKIDARGQTLKVTMARQGMSSLDEALLSVLWQPGSSRTLNVNDCGGELKVESATNLLLINVTDNDSISDTILNATVGQVIYELPYSETSDTGLFLKGDSRPIVNQGSSVITQLYIQSGADHPEVLLRYRPIISSIAYENDDNSTIINNIRLYIVNLNSSQDIESMGEVPLTISCINDEDTIRSYSVPYQVDSITIDASLGGIQGQVSVSILSNASGSTINLETIICDVKIERWLR
jgi:hypothetical protein